MKRNREKDPSSTDQRGNPHFIDKRKAISEKLSAVTALQRIAADCVVECSWLVQAQLSERKPSEQKSDPSISGTATVSRYYGWDRQSMRAAINFLSDVIRDFAEYPEIREEWKERIIKGFGEEFLADLTEWVPPNWTGTLLAEHLTAHAKMVGRPLPKMEDALPNSSEPTTKRVRDHRQLKEMILKLLREEQRHWKTFCRLLT